MLLLFHGKQPSCYESIGASQRQRGCEKKSQGESEKEIKESKQKEAHDLVHATVKALQADVKY